MPQILLSLPLYYEKYKEWVQANPRQASDMETTLKWTSYFVAGRIRNSHTASELVYCLSNLLVLHNDRIISKLQRIGNPIAGEVLKVWLTVLEYSEVFLELSAQSVWGTRGKWLIIAIVQLFKCVCRLLLVYYYKNSVTESPPIPPLVRHDLFRTGIMKNSENIQIEDLTWTLCRSGKVLRKVDASPALHERTWKVLHKSKVPQNGLQQQVKGVKLAAETVYICKPIIHLGSMACFGSNTWKPWMLSLALDLFSLYLFEHVYKKDSNLRPQERLLISRRYVGLMLYLLRSPFYEGYSKRSIESALRRTGKRIPLAHFLTKPVLKYLPFWQSIYFYTWSN